MDDKILVRLYSVGFGDCIYVRIPDGDAQFHMLIDCGTSGPALTCKAAIDNLRSLLPEAHGKKRLDLLVVTHPHADHIKGFDPAWFADVQIDRIWLSAFIQADHPQASKARALSEVAQSAARALLGSGLSLAPGIRELLARGVQNPTALKALREDLARASGAYPRYPLYIARDIAERLANEDRAAHEIESQEGLTTFRGFREDGTVLRVLAPEWDIDGYYLGQGTPGERALADPFLLRRGPSGAAPQPGSSPPAALLAADQAAAPAQPANISARDFHLLRNQMRYSALAFSQQDDALKNNTSVVLLLEWRGKRLLFTGDAEWQGDPVQAGERNGAWDVMLSIPSVEQALLQPLDFFKVGHHGSHNGTPFLRGGEERVLLKLLDPQRSQVVVSTVSGQHGETNPVPYPPLMQELGRLAANRRVYSQAPEPSLREVPQPERTDLDSVPVGEGMRALDILV